MTPCPNEILAITTIQAAIPVHPHSEETVYSPMALPERLRTWTMLLLFVGATSKKNTSCADSCGFRAPAALPVRFDVSSFLHSLGSGGLTRLLQSIQCGGLFGMFQASFSCCKPIEPRMLFRSPGASINGWESLQAIESFALRIAVTLNPPIAGFNA